MEMESLNSAFKQYYLENKRLVVYAAYSVLKNFAVAEDIASEVFINLYTHLLNGKQVKNIRGYLVASAKHRSLNYIRDAKKIIDLQPSVVDDGFEESANIKIFANEILNKLYCRNKRWFEIVTSYYILDLSVKEIASEMGCSEQAVRNVLTRSRDYLRTEYKDYIIITAFLFLYYYYCK